MTSPPFCSEIRAILLDIEGTTTPIDFVFDTLFPFAAANVETFLQKNSYDPEIKQIVAELRQTWSGAAPSGVPVWIESSPEEKVASVVAYVRWLMARDSKITPLKALQGRIWEQGFSSGRLKGQVYPDVPLAFARWRAQGKRVAIFSSGSVLAQKLLFAHSTAGDLSGYIDAYFDTTTGPKREPASYSKVAGELRLPPQQILFVSDVPAELDAAAVARLHTVHSRRPRIAEAATSNHCSIRTFDELFAEKRAG